MKAVAFAFSLAILSATAWSADKQGGHEIEVGKYHVELVVKDRDLSLYVRDEVDKPIDPKTAKASANVLSGKDKATVEFKPAGAEMLAAQVPFSVGKEAKVVVTISVAGAKHEQARFSLGQKQDHKGHKH